MPAPWENDGVNTHPLPLSDLAPETQLCRTDRSAHQAGAPTSYADPASYTRFLAFFLPS